MDKLLTAGLPIWTSQVGPQTDALESLADELFYGGAAGGGKTDLLLGTALTRHRKAIIFRREGKELTEIIERATELIGSRDGFNGQEDIWRKPSSYCERLEFGSCKNLGDEQKYQGRPHDLKAFDEITRFLKIQYQYLCGWNRTKDRHQRARIICAGNPPTSSEGDWVVEHWGPWLDDQHSNPALPGELRWFAVIAGESIEVESPEPFERDGEIITPLSRTFIRSAVDDNVYYRDTGYRAKLQALPEPLRSQMLKGDFNAGKEGDPWQVIPTEWVKRAQDRWEPQHSLTMDTLGVDPARGGADETVISPRFGEWFAEQVVQPGTETPDGPSVASLVVSVMRDGATANIDVIGVGGSVYDHLKGNGVSCEVVDGRHKATERDRTNTLGFYNMRAQVWWKMREALDPDYGDNISLPPDRQLSADLCAPRWTVTPRGIKVEEKEETVKRIGRSPDRGDAAVYGLVPATSKVKIPKPPRSRGGWMRG